LHSNRALIRRIMLYIDLPKTDTVRKLSFFLAMEEYVARYVDAEDCFFMWQVEPTVIFGRNQQMEAEVNVDYCRQHHINMVRRKSGGGCVYADQSNIMLSFITSEDNVGFAFNRFINMELLFLRKLGIDAVGTSHNDVMIGDRKVSGTASYHLPGRSIVHGTLLYDTDMDHMLHAITPGPEKLEAKGIQSVRQRITLLKDHISMPIEELKSFIRSTLCDDTRTLSPSDVAGIEKIEESYLREEFIHLL